MWSKSPLAPRGRTVIPKKGYKISNNIEHHLKNNKYEYEII
jgi:DNA-binding winged helix-turn-helix (wHTH) protein